MIEKTHGTSAIEVVAMDVAMAQLQKLSQMVIMTPSWLTAHSECMWREMYNNETT